MTAPDPNLAGYSEAAATVFTWLADKVLGGAKKALDLGWERGQWAIAQDRYDAQIIKQYGSIRIFGQTTPKPLKEVFTDVYMLDKPTAFTRFDPKALREHLWEQDRSVPFRVGERLPADQLLGRGSKFFILGKPGAGKTTFLKHLAVREAQRGKWGNCLSKIPIFVPLKQFSESGKSIFDFIVEQFAVCHFPDAAPFVAPLLKEGKALVLFDGLDEVTRDAEARSDRRSQVTEQIEQFARQYDGCHIVVTCRIAATEYMFDSAFVYLEMADFAPDQVDAFVRNWFWDAAEPDASAGLADQMLAEWAKPEHAGIRDLGRNPLLLTLLCLNYAETLSFPPRRVEIYQEALGALLKKWDSSRQIQRGSLYRTLSLGRKQQMFSRIAYDGFLQDEILFPQADLEGRLKAYLAHVPEVPDAVDIDAEAMLREIVAQHGIFAEQSRGLYSFAHLTFQEYYVAKYLAESPAPDALDPLMARVTDEKWREVFLLTASLLSDATPFLAAFEAALHRLITPRPRLVAWLRWVAMQALASHAGYRQAAMRVFYILSLAEGHARVLADAGVFHLDLYLAIESAGDIDLDCDLARDHALALAMSSASHPELVTGLDSVPDPSSLACYPLATTSELMDRVGRVRELCQLQGRVAVCEAISAVELAGFDASSEARLKFRAEIEKIIDAQGTLARYHRLQAKARKLTCEQEQSWPLDRTDNDALVAYLQATQLFYDCLQLAYTPDRRAFEDRILLPPPPQGVPT